MRDPEAAVSHDVAAGVARVEAAARDWIDTPLFHSGVLSGQGRLGGIDCLGLVVFVAIEAAVVPWTFADLIAAGGDDYYGRVPNADRLVGMMDRFALPIAVADHRAGDVLALSWGARDVPMHLVIRVGRPGRQARDMIVHADPLAKPGRVVETGYAADFPDRACRAWRFAGLAG